MNPILALLRSILIAALSWYLALAGSRDRLPRNAIVGIRLPTTVRAATAAETTEPGGSDNTDRGT